KVPGPVVRTGNVDMDFNYSDHFGKTPSTGYETLLYDCMSGDPTLFQRADSVEDGWAVVTPILDLWKALPPRTFPNYAAGAWGPKEAADLRARGGRAGSRVEPWAPAPLGLPPSAVMFVSPAPRPPPPGLRTPRSPSSKHRAAAASPPATPP